MEKMGLSKEQEIIKILFKDILSQYNSRSLSKIIGISHAGTFKILKRLEKREIINGKRIGQAVIYSLNTENPITSREIEMALTLEAQDYKRWIEEFKGLVGKIRFAILFGSAIRNERSANDIDLLVVANKNKFKDIRKVVDERRRFLLKRVHLILQTSNDFKSDVAEKNKPLLEIIRTGIVLFGQEEIKKILY